MATANARASNVRVAPRKAGLVAGLIRGKKVAEARDILLFTHKRGAEPIRKVLESAVANAENAAAERHERLDTDAMVISRVVVNPGMTLHRFIAAARGRATRIRKRYSHIEITIAGGEKK